MNNNIVCFAKETKVLLSNKQTKNIEDIKPGDEIFNCDIEKNKVVIEVVEKIASSIHSISSIVEFSNGIKLESTIDHPYFVKNKGWCSLNPASTNDNYKLNVKELVIGDKCIFFDGDKLAETRIIDIETKVKESRMYVISGGVNNSFFANGILVSDENIMELDLTQKGVEFTLLEIL